jgi:glycosyltransferase involved in cell wall biosynthesis
MKIMMLGRWLPVGRRGTDATREQRLARQLARLHRLTLAFVTDVPNPAGAVSALRGEFGDLEFAVVTRGWKTLSSAVSLATGSSATMAYARSAALGARLRDRLRVGSYDLICVTSSSMIQYALDADPAIPIVMDFADVDSYWWMSQARERSFGANFYRTEAARLRLAEQVMVRRAARSIVASAEAARRVEGPAEAQPIVVPSGVDVEHFIPALRMPGTPAVLYLGALDRDADVTAASDILREMVPAVRRRHAAARFLVAGRALPASARELARIPGVEVANDVADIRPILHRATLAVAPHPDGAGTRRALLEAMCTGLPLVTTTGSAASLGARAGRDLLAEETPRDCVAPVADLLGNPSQRAELGGHAAAFVRARYAWEVATARLAGVVETVLPASHAAARLDAPRIAGGDFA